MDELISKTKELESTLLDNDYSKLKDILKEITKNERVVMDSLASDNIALKVKFDTWYQRYHNYLLWLLQIVDELEKLKEKGIVLTPNETVKLKNLLSILTKYNSLNDKVSDDDVKKRIQDQINNLYQTTFYTKDLLIKSREESKEEAISILPFFSLDNNITLKDIRNIIFEYSEVTGKSPAVIENKLFKKESESVKYPLRIFDNVKLSLYAMKYSNSSVGDVVSQLIYPPNVERKIRRIGILQNDGVVIVSSNKELDKLVNDGGTPISAELTINKLIDGWYKIEDIKK